MGLDPWGGLDPAPAVAARQPAQASPPSSHSLPKQPSLQTWTTQVQAMLVGVAIGAPLLCTPTYCSFHSAI